LGEADAEREACCSEDGCQPDGQCLRRMRLRIPPYPKPVSGLLESNVILIKNVVYIPYISYIVQLRIALFLSVK